MLTQAKKRFSSKCIFFPVTEQCSLCLVNQALPVNRTCPCKKSVFKNCEFVTLENHFSVTSLLIFVPSFLTSQKTPYEIGPKYSFWKSLSSMVWNRFRFLCASLFLIFFHSQKWDFRVATFSSGVWWGTYIPVDKMSEIAPLPKDWWAMNGDKLWRRVRIWSVFRVTFIYFQK